MSNDKISKLVARINQLRAISKSTHSKAESETCLQLVSKIIAEHQLSEATIQAETGKTDDPIDLDSEHIIYESGRKTPWKFELAVGLAKLNGLFIYNANVRSSKSHRMVSRYRIIGKRSNIAIALYMWDYLLEEIQYWADMYIPQRRGTRGVNPERESWSLGCVRGFLAKMQAERDSVLKQATSTALVFIGNQAKEAEEAFLEKTGIALTYKNYHSKAQTNYDSFQSGYRKGQTLNVNPGMNAGDTKGPKKLGG